MNRDQIKYVAMFTMLLNLSLIHIQYCIKCFFLQQLQRKGQHICSRKKNFIPYQLCIRDRVARVAEETSYIVLNGNYALQAGYSVSKDALAYETSDSEAAKTYVNVIAVKEGNENSDKIKALVDVLKSDEIKDFINEKYDGAVIPFEDSDDAEDEDTEAADADESADAEADTADEAAEETDAE